jgi:hypothetical protein
VFFSVHARRNPAYDKNDVLAVIFADFQRKEHIGIALEKPAMNQ